MTILIEGHSLVVVHDPELDQEVVRLDGDSVSAARTFAGTWHSFTAEGALWEVQTRAAPWPASEISAVRRDGETLYPEP